jgi:glycosyltransferase involved in cell wall biosynthesis
MNILIINKRAPFEGRGAEQVIWKIGKGLAANGHHVLFFTASPEEGANTPSIENLDFEFVQTSAKPTRGMIEFFLKAPTVYPSVYSRFEPDVVYDNPSPFPFHPAHIYGDAQVVNKVHAIYRSLAFSCKNHPLVKIGTIFGEETYRLFRDKYFITNSDSTAERLSKLVNKNRTRIFSNPIGIKASEFEFDFSLDSQQVTVISKMNSRKGIFYLLQAWERIMQRHPDANLVIAGSGPEAEQLQKLGVKLDLDRVEFAGYVTEEEKKELLRESAVFALPTLYEGFGITNLEAMASGCAVVSTDTWGVKDYLEHEKNGLAVAPKSTAELAEAVSRLLEDTEFRRHLAASGRRTAEQYSMEESLNRELRHIEKIAST